MQGSGLTQLTRARALFVIAMVSAALTCFALAGSIVNAVTTVPTTMNFQGRLTDTTGSPVADGLYNMQFRLFTVSSGGSSVWNETRETTSRVQVTNGLFATKLGDVTPLSASLFASGALYFEITLPTPATATCGTAACASWETAMSPRHQMSTSAYAYNAETLDGIDGAALAQLSANNTFTGTNTVNVASTSALAVVNGATNLFKADTTSSQVVIGQADAAAAVLVLDSSSGADPSNVAGSMYYNSTSGKFRCYQGGWVDCITPAGGATLQTAYDASSSPATITTTAAKSVKIVTGAAPTADIFSVDTSANPVATNNVNGIDVNYAGGAGVIEGAGLRVDYTPGGTSGSTWDGVRIVANATGPASGVTSYGIKLEGPSSPGAGTEVGLRVASGFDIGVDIASGGLQLSAMNDPATPAAGNLRVFAKTNAGRTMLRVKSPSGVDYSLQPFFATNSIAMYRPVAASTSITTNTTFGTALSLNHFTTGTTASTTATTSATVGTGSLFASMRRAQIGTSTAASTVGDLRFTTAQNFRGNATDRGGFYLVARFGISAYQTGARSYVGMSSLTTALTNAEVSSNINLLGMGCDTADTTFSIMGNDATGTATKTALGANFPCNTSAADVYELRLFSIPNTSTVYYSVARLNTTDFTEGTITAAADMPANTTLLSPHFFINNNATAARASMDIMSLYVETDN